MNSEKNAIENLKSEHRLIESVLDALDSYVRALCGGESVGREDLPLFIRFLREFADTQHHSKEEKILFVALVQSGFSSEGGPVACMLHEHEVGRELVGMLGKCAMEPAWSDDVLERIAAASTEFSSMLRAHIYKEDNMLYEMARAQLSLEHMAEVDKLCAQRDQESASAGLTAEIVSLANDLITRYGCSQQSSSWTG